MGFLLAGTAILLGTAACTGGGDDAVADKTVIAMQDARACGLFGAFFVSADEKAAVFASISPEEFRAIDEATEFELTKVDALLLSGDDLSDARCTDDPTPVDDSATVESGTLTISTDGNQIDLALRGASTKSTTVEDVEFTGLDLEPPAG